MTLQAIHLQTGVGLWAIVCLPLIRSHLIEYFLSFPFRCIWSQNEYLDVLKDFSNKCVLLQPLLPPQIQFKSDDLQIWHCQKFQKTYNFVNIWLNSGINIVLFKEMKQVLLNEGWKELWVKCDLPLVLEYCQLLS